MSQNEKKILWHYAPWAYLPKMVNDGSLQPSNAGAPTKRPLLWFSKNQSWEPTATKLLSDSRGRLMQMSFVRQSQLFGCIRFGIAANDDRLLDWEAACSTRDLSAKHKTSLEAAGKAVGGKPQDWFGSRAAIPLQELDLHVWVGRWSPAESATEMARFWQDHVEKP